MLLPGLKVSLAGDRSVCLPLDLIRLSHCLTARSTQGGLISLALPSNESFLPSQAMWMYHPALWALCSKVRALRITCLDDEVLKVYISGSAFHSHDREPTHQ